ncbi:hypothetical protein QRX50_33495 [Amycolatopsis carbonis]|uniref:MmyB-like transcription regulator ligand binding domain-containing protein n=1 Tax=Amycolatopsis carbonis TaxID=715471 RepID=A0A9Y2I9L8_9PSEU|nr:hypothetical protein [Amycolatopsis sp. 2-15]WIX76355.1 hypothetical protein QRX50_33495 [Amycolatopsis sp. 2-15]
MQDRLTNVLAANAIATALSSHYAAGRNLLREVLLDPAERDFRVDWDETTADGVGGLRASLGRDVGDPAAIELVTELSAKSERFRELWFRHDTKPRTGHLARFCHPAAGPLDLHSYKFTLPGPDALSQVVFHAVPGSRHTDALASPANLAHSK